MLDATPSTSSFSPWVIYHEYSDSKARHAFLSLISHEILSGGYASGLPKKHPCFANGPVVSCMDKF